MAIIKGVTAAKVGEVSPYVEDIGGLKEGIKARDTRANELRDMIAQSKAAMLKETRDNDEDFALAQQLEKGFSNDVSSLVDAADMDFSNISRDQLQTLATTYAGKTDFRVLSEAKRNQDEANKMKQEIESKNGTVSYFGNPEYNPLTGSLYTADGGYKKFTGNWGMEKTLDHSAAAKKLYDGIGKSMWSSEAYKNDPNFTQLGKKQLSDGTFVPDFMAYWEKATDKTSDNWKQVDAIIKGGIDGFIKGAEGNQYYRLQLEHAKYKLKMSDSDAEQYARDKVKDIIFTYGESEKTDTEDHLVTRTPLGRDQSQPVKSTGPGRGSSGAGDVNKPVPTGTDITHAVSFHGLPSDTKSVFDNYDESTSTNVNLVNVVGLTNSNKGAISNITNPNILASSATLVRNPEPDPNGNTPTSDQGFIYKMYEGDDQKFNPTAVHFKSGTGINSHNTTSNNYNKLFDNVENGALVQMITDENGKITKEEYSVDRLVDEVGDDLLHTDDLREVLNGWVGSDGNAVEGLESSDAGISWAKNNSKGAVNMSLSTYIVDPKTGEASISPALLKLRERYEDKLKSNLNDKEAVLYEAKLRKTNLKIAKGESFMVKKEVEFDKIKQQTEIINERTTMLYNNILLAGRKNNIPDELTNGLIGEGDLTKREYKNYIRSSKRKAYNKIGINNTSLDQDVYPDNPNYSEEDNKKYQNRLRGIYDMFNTSLLGGDYNIDDVVSSNPRLYKMYPNGVDKLSPEQILLAEIDKDVELTKYVKSIPVMHKGIKTSFYSQIGYADELDRSTTNLYNTFYKDEDGFITPKEGVQNTFDNLYNVTLKETFKVQNKNANIAQFVEDVENMNNVFTREGISLYMPSAANTEGTGWANATYIKQQLKMWRGQANTAHKGWRNTRFGKESEEEFDKDALLKDMTEQYNSLKDAGQVSGGKSVEQWMDDQFNDVYFKGIRMDIDNPEEPFVAHYELPNGKSVEHNISLGRDKAIDYFGIPAVYFQLGTELSTSLRDNDNMYADFEGMGENQSIRLHQNLLPNGLGSGTQRVEKGQFYLLYDKNIGENDPNIGSKDYHPAAENVERKVFQSYDHYFKWFQSKNASEVAILSTFKRQRDALITLKNPNYVFPPDHPFITNKLTYDEIMNKISEWTTKVAKGEKVNFNKASDLNAYTTAGVVRTQTDNDGNTKYNLDPKTLQSMSNDEQLDLVYTLRPDMKKVKLYQDNSGQSYTANPAKMKEVKVDDLNSFHIPSKLVKTKFEPDMANFITDVNSIVSLLKNKSNSNSNNMQTSSYNLSNADYNKLDPMKLITITSGLRSIQDNLRAYNSRGSGNITNITNSNHTRGQAVDIRTEPARKWDSKNNRWVTVNDPNRHHEGGKALWEFLKTKSGKELLKKHNLRAYYHKIEGDQYHIDISKASSKSPAGSVFDDMGNDYSTTKI